MDKIPIRKCIAEMIGTAVLVLVGCGTAVAMGCAGASADSAYVGTALAFGLAVVAMAYSIGNVSGCHINPAISLAMYIDGRMSLAEMASYIFAQCVGAMLGALGIYAIAGSGCGFGANGLPVGVENPALAGLVVETLLTFVFVLTVLGVTSKKEHGAVAGLAIGFALVAVHLVGIRYTGTGVNPARSLAPALLAGGDALANLWVFVIGPLAGGALAAICHRYLAGEKE